MRAFQVTASLLLLSFSLGCSKRAEEDKWWASVTSAGKEAVQALNLAAHEKKSLVISGDGRVRLGVLVREVEEMKSRSKDEGDDSGGVFLTQSSSGRFVGTYYSASDLFTLSDGREFVVENRSPVASDILVYRDPKP